MTWIIIRRESSLNVISLLNIFLACSFCRFDILKLIYSVTASAGFWPRSTVK